MTDTAPHADQQLREHIATALRDTARTGWAEHRSEYPAKYRVHSGENGGPGHRYDSACALCTADVDALADAVLAVVQPELDRLHAERDELRAELDGRDEKARKRWIKKQEKQLGIRYADFRAGRWEMDLAMGREMAAAYVAMAKTMLGDAPNYTETRLEFDVKIAESPEIYTLVVQRHAPGALTPHEARLRAEVERDEARTEIDRLGAQLAGVWPCVCSHLPNQHHYDTAISRNFCRSCRPDEDLHDYTAAPA